MKSELGPWPKIHPYQKVTNLEHLSYQDPIFAGIDYYAGIHNQAFAISFNKKMKETLQEIHQIVQYSI